MNNKGVGAVFCLIAAILMSAWYMTAAIYGNHTSSWSDEYFGDLLAYIGPGLIICAAVALIAGIAFLVSGLVRDSRKAAKKE